MRIRFSLRPGAIATASLALLITAGCSHNTTKDSSLADNLRSEDLQTRVELTASEAMQGTEVRVPVPGQKGPVTVKIPPGVKDGTRLRLKGIGMPGINGAPRGDYYIVLHVK